MKTRLIVLAASLFITHSSFAQFNFGAKAGANITKIDGKSFKDEFRYGYHLGGFVEIGLGGKISVQPEVLFNQLQTRVDSTFKNVYSNALNFSENKNIKLNYLSIPLVLNYKLGNVISLHAGPQFGILIDQGETILENGKKAFDKGDLSMVGGVQLKITKIRLIGRYIVGLNNINDIDDQNKWTNQGFQLSLGLAL